MAHFIALNKNEHDNGTAELLNLEYIKRVYRKDKSIIFEGILEGSTQERYLVQYRDESERDSDFALITQQLVGQRGRF